MTQIVLKLVSSFFIFQGCFFCNLYSAPPREIPSDLFNEYTLNCAIPVIDYYMDGTYSSTEPLMYSRELIDSYIIKVLQGQQNYYGETDSWLYAAIREHSIEGKTVGIIGSTTPWYEAIVLAFGGIPFTIEYNRIVSDDPRLEILTFGEYVKQPIQFDVILSISSIEHDGLGRYGDPLNPNGDFDFMKLAKKSFLKDEGFMLIAFPVGKDAVAWNAHRIYGPIRLPMLFEGWKVGKSYGFSESLFDAPLGYCIQPVFYLEKAL